ncbi:fatty acid desaturase [Luteipulveratus flavus]|uniref:Fatty acid desaturase n=1 Tax=Luteipulveratus flavus TaxID=3031728 RepID=A0ABT6CA20_9MICO|nr:fatty acid desaturase [Luteipulveratus sp. YIM 133296]MDF8265363.1 fatty acid desaturase [Luteipulveratus sp. YIM 133296]
MAVAEHDRSTVPDGSTEQWRDKKRYLWLLGLVIPSLAIIAIVTFLLTGWTWVVWIGPILILGIVPAIDLVAGLDRSNPPEEIIEALEKDRYYRWITFFYLPIQYVGLVGATAALAGHNPVGWTAEWLGVASWLAQYGWGADLVVDDLHLTLVQKIGIAVSIGCVGGIGINTAHELGHKKESHERWLAKIALAQSFYGHFYIEHNRGHHVRVATPEDPASSRVGESFYQFWPRTVWGSLRSAWRLERKRYARKHQHPYRIGNDVLNAWLMSSVLFATLTGLFGLGVLPYLVLQAVVGFSLLEVVNYMEHYGMRRQMVGIEGRRRYERVNPSHSWNSNNIATNVLLYHLQRHSDHHATPTRRYQTLRDFKESPALPTGYAGMIMLAVVPAIWRRVMDPRVLAHFDGDMSRANLSPRHREAVLVRYPVPTGPQVVGTDPTVRDVDGEILAARCPGCSYVYEVAAGDEHEGFPAGTAWREIPDSWCCPDCGVREKVDFVPVERAVAD